MQVEQIPLVAVTSPVHVHIATGACAVVRLVIVNAVSLNQGVGFAQHAVALEGCVQIGSARNKVALHIGGQLAANLWWQAVHQTGAGLEFE